MAIAYPKLPENKDRRVKIPKEQHEVIRQMRKDGMTFRAIADVYNVNHRLIIFIVYPERQLKAKANRDWRKYHDPKTWAETMREHRKYKKSIQGKEYAEWRKESRIKYKK